MALIKKVRPFFKRAFVRTFIALLCIGFALGISYFLWTQRTYYTVLPLKFTISDCPYVDVVVDKVSYPLKIDLGSRLEVNIYSDVLAQCAKSSYGVEKWKNFKGTEFEYQAYLLPRINIGSLTFKNPIAVGFPREITSEEIIWKNYEGESPQETVGELGRGLLKKTNFLLDVENSRIIFTNSPKKLREDGYDLSTFEKVSFDLISKGMILEIGTDLGKKSFLLDTGCSWTLMHRFLYPQESEQKMSRYGLPLLNTSRFIINGTDFGAQDLFFLDITKELNDIDGFLGMDFIKKHVMYIDFSRKVLYIRK